MKKNLKTYVSGALTAAVMCTAVCAAPVYATQKVETIPASYENVKVYVDDALLTLKDVTGKVVEPFLYDGTTYLPVRGTAEAAGMEVKWDDATRSVYLTSGKGSETPAAEDTYTLKPYQKEWYYEFLPSRDEKFKMNGKYYTNGFELGVPKYAETKGYAVFKLDGKYDAFSAKIGVANSSYLEDASVTFYVDDAPVMTLQLLKDGDPQEISIPVKGGKMLKIERNDRNTDFIGFADAMLK